MMNKEQIEQAARDFADGYFPEKEHIDRYALGKRAGYMRGFIQGADWRISSVWHTTADIPTTGKRCLVVYMADGKKQYRVDWRSEYEWVVACHYDKILRWAYISDLLPEERRAQNNGHPATTAFPH